MLKLGEFVVILITMIMVLEFLGVPTGLSLILEDFGVTINPATSELVSVDLEDNSFWMFIFGNSGALIVLLGGATVIVGLFAKSYDVSLVILPIITITATLFASTFYAVIKYVHALPSTETWMVGLITTIFIALAVGFTWSCIDYFAGR